MNDLKLYNSLTRKKESFRPRNEQKVTMYVCGITPYDTTHLGHAFTYIHFDVLFRFLKHLGHNPIYTQNVTDINDRDTDILERAKQQGVAWNKLAKYWTQRFLHDMKALNWQMPTNYLKASEQIGSMIRIIEVLLTNGIAYEKRGNIFLNILKVKEYGKLSRLNSDQMLEKAKEFDEDLDNPLKKHKLDITLWRAAKQNQPEHIPSFDSPFGKGRPGWHIECSAMATSSLGKQIDIHGGGQDLIYPHHESEIAQSEQATGKKPFARSWLHTGIVMYQGKKMSKSLGNLVLVANLLKKYSPNALRFVLLSHHYRSSWGFKEEELEKAQRKITKLLYSSSERSGSRSSKDESSRQARTIDFKLYLNNDLDTPGLLNVLTTGDVNKGALSVLGFNV